MSDRHDFFMTDSGLLRTLLKVQREPEEHLEPEPGAIVQFPGVTPLVAGVVGYRWQVSAVYLDPRGIPMYRLLRVDALDQWLQVTQEVMDGYGRLLIRGEEASDGK